MLEFHGLSNKNPYEYPDAINSVIEGITNLTNKNRVILTLFPKTLKEKVKAWLSMLVAKSITTFDDLSTAFLLKYFQSKRPKKLDTT